MLARIGLDSSDFNNGIARAERAAKQFGRSVSNELKGMVGGYLTASFVIDRVGEAFERAGAITDLSDRLGIDVETLQELQYAAQQTGTDINAFAKSIQNINKARAEALGDPTGEKANVFARYGIGLKELQNMSGEGIFMSIGQAVKEAVNPQNELVFATELLGKTAADVFPAMRQGIVDLAKAAHDAGQVLDKEVVKRLDAAGDRYQDVKNSIGNTFATALVWAADAWSTITRSIHYGIGPGSAIATIERQADIAAANAPQGKAKERFEAIEGSAKDVAQKASTKSKTKELVPAEYSYKPQSDEISRIGGFTRSAQNAMVASLDMIREATMKTAEAATETAANTRAAGGNFP